MAFETELERLMVRLVGDSSNYEAMLKSAIASSQRAEAAIESLSSTVNQLKMAFLGFAGFKTVEGFLLSAGGFEQTNIAFETMIGNAEETKKTLKDLTDFAAKTPFEMPEIEQAARGLIQFGERGDELMRTLNDIGNAASGTSTQFGMVALIFNQIRGVGKLLTQDFRQLSTRGILSLNDIAKHFNTTTEAAQKMLSTGQITFADVKAIFHELSQEGGRFANLMEKQSQSFLGLKSTFSDTFNLMKRALGEVLLPIATKFLKTTIDITERMRVWITKNTESVQTFFKVAAAVAAFTTTVTTLMLVMRGFAATIAFVQALTGVGLAKVLISITVAAGAAAAAWLGVDYAIRKTTSAMNEAKQEGSQAAQEAQKAMAATLGEEDSPGGLLFGKISVKSHMAMVEFERRMKWRTQALIHTQKEYKEAQERYREIGGMIAAGDVEALPEYTGMGWSLDTMGKAHERARQEMEATYQEKVNALKKEREVAQEEISKQMAARDQLRQTITAEIKEIKKKSFAVAAGWKAWEVEANRLAIVFGQSSEVVKEFIKQNQEAEAIAERAQLRKMLESAKDAAEGLTDIEKTRRRFEKEGDYEGLAAFDYYQEQIKARKDAEEKSTEAQREFNRRMEDGKRLIEEYSTPLEKYKKKIADVTKLYQMGALGKGESARGVFRKEIEKAELELAKLEQKDINVKFNITGVDAAIVGTSEALERLREYQASGPMGRTVSRGGSRFIGFAMQGTANPMNMVTKDNLTSQAEAVGLLRDLVKIARAHWKGGALEVAVSELTK